MFKDQSLELLNEIIKTSKTIGSVKTKAVIMAARLDENSRADFNIYKLRIENYLIDALCKKFVIDRDHLFKHRNRDEKRLKALQIGFVVTKKVLDYTLEEIGEVFKKDPSNVNKEIIKYNRLSDENSRDKTTINICNAIAHKLKVFMYTKLEAA